MFLISNISISCDIIYRAFVTSNTLTLLLFFQRCRHLNITPFAPSNVSVKFLTIFTINVSNFKYLTISITPVSDRGIARRTGTADVHLARLRSQHAARISPGRSGHHQTLPMGWRHLLVRLRGRSVTSYACLVVYLGMRSARSRVYLLRFVIVAAGTNSIAYIQTGDG